MASPRVLFLNAARLNFDARLSYAALSPFNLTLLPSTHPSKVLQVPPPSSPSSPAGLPPLAPLPTRARLLSRALETALAAVAE